MNKHDTEAPILAFIDEVACCCKDNGQSFGLRELLFCIRDIPYGRPTSPRDALSVLFDWTGTCSGKHLLASRVLGAMGLGAALYCLTYRLDDAHASLPREVVERYADQGIWDVHNYLELDGPSGPIKVDVTWSRELACLGFPTTLNWDGATDFRIAAPPGEAMRVHRADDLIEVKEALLSRLNTPAARSRRERYIEDLASFASRHTATRSRQASIRETLAVIQASESRSGA
jgi:hypothetical protein